MARSTFTGWDPTDLAAYAAAAGTPLAAAGQILTVAVDNPANPLLPDGTGDDFEVAMDAQAILAAAPAAKQRMYFAEQRRTADVFDQMATDGQARLLQVASTGSGGCASRTSPAWYRDAVGQAVDRMLAAGVTLYAAAGDAGMYDCSRPGWGRTRPLSTSQQSPRRRRGRRHADRAGGDGLGRRRREPRHDVRRQRRRRRGVGRVRPALVAGRPRPARSMGWCPERVLRRRPLDGARHRGEGLSGGSAAAHPLGAPTWAGLAAAALSGAGRTTGVGDVHALLVRAPEAFRDITAGSNGYPATEGFDLATGLGVPDWSVLGPLLTGMPVPADGVARGTAKAALVTGTDGRARFSWAGKERAPSSGLASYAVTVTQVGGGAVWQATTGATSHDLTLSAGRAYVLWVQPRRRGQRRSGRHRQGRRAVRRHARRPQRQLGTAVGDRRYRGSHVASATRGSRLSFAATGHSVVLGLVKAPTGGYPHHNELRGMRYLALTDTLRPLAAEDGGEAKNGREGELTRRHDVGVDPSARDRRLADPVAIVARDHDRIS